MQQGSPWNYCYKLVLLFLAIVSVPCMLLSKRFILKKQHEAIQKQQGQSYAPLEETDESIHVATSGGSHGHVEFEFSEIFVHQFFHTIEFFAWSCFQHLFLPAYMGSQVSI
ncbi:hypothetical protein F2Q69_00040717 [Brassica cretica]|uniref:V-type proton ATPase subunit a n=1 Tax=Brassica cretica TaxID=69181 RepID=A0A8S9N501_BRACR|nr:hypothetical protein F2Q69_00040717 [Brassica cretica]